jgi:hypothetical protein
MPVKNRGFAISKPREKKPKVKEELPQVPTLNPYYNQLLIRWKEAGCESPPECEECQEDMTGKMIHDTSIAWLCTSCKEKSEQKPQEQVYREDFHANRMVASR